MMENLVPDNHECISRVPVDIQLQMCRQAARAFGHLCEVVCERFGQEGVKVIEEHFLSDSALLGEGTPYREGDLSREVSTTLIKLLASWGIRRSS